MSNSEQTTLASLAMLKVNFDLAKSDYLDYFIPFVKIIISSYGRREIIAHDVADKIEEEFGLKIPIYVVEKLLWRLAKRRTIRKENHKYHLAREIDTGPYEERRREASSNQQRFIAELKEFCQTKYQKDFDSLDWEKAIAEYLRDYSLECLRAYYQGSAIPATSLKEEDAEELVFYLHRFLVYISGTASRAFDDFMSFVKGTLLCNAVLCTEISSAKQKFKQSQFFFDTPLLIAALSLGTEPKTRSVLELVDLLYELGGRCCVFSHTVEELTNVISFAAQNIENPAINRGLVIELRRKKFTASDVVLLKESVGDKLERLKFEIVATPRYDLNFQIDESEVEEAIDEEIQYLNPNALRFDINSIRSIYALRKDKVPTTIEKANAVFVTSNAGLAAAARKFGRTEPGSSYIPVVVTDYSLGNIAWIKAPVKHSTLPARQILSFANAALEIREPLWTKYLKEIERLQILDRISERDLEILRYSPLVQGELMDLTRGSDTLFQEETVTEILDRIKQEMLAEKEEELNSERKSSEELQKNLGSAEAWKQNVTFKLEERAAKFAGFWTNIVFAVVSLALFLVLIAGLFTGGSSSTLRVVLIIIGTIFSVANLVFGFCFWNYREKLRHFFYVKKRNSLFNEFEPPS